MFFIDPDQLDRLLRFYCGLGLACRNTTAFVDEAKILAAHARHTPANLSDRALKRRRTFPSKAAALRSYATRQAFKSFHAPALSAYVIHGFREMPGTPRITLIAFLPVSFTSALNQARAGCSCKF